MLNPLYADIYALVRLIPLGQVATYGQIASFMGPPVTAQHVGEAMAALRATPAEPPVPWQRVINAQGKVSTGPRQQDLLEREGVHFDTKGVTNLQRWGWAGPDPAWATAHGYVLPSQHGGEARRQLELL